MGVVCDAISVKGRVSDIIKYIELSIGRPFQWIVCLFHLMNCHFDIFLTIMMEKLPDQAHFQATKLSQIYFN